MEFFTDNYSSFNYTYGYFTRFFVKLHHLSLIFPILLTNCIIIVVVPSGHYSISTIMKPIITYTKLDRQIGK